MHITWLRRLARSRCSSGSVELRRFHLLQVTHDSTALIHPRPNLVKKLLFLYNPTAEACQPVRRADVTTDGHSIVRFGLPLNTLRCQRSP
jgi:hypothetical protein